jgi:D-beta-D-heptose 7-phosphate kinase/D-beta-D-heptose 1-phosphate adenosyltransferase
MKKEKAIIVSGYFNPIHKGHLDLFKKAKSQADKLWVIVNSDFQRELKGSTLDFIKQFALDKIMNLDSYKKSKKAIGFTV